MSATPRTTRTVRKPRKHDMSDYRVYGYVLNEDILLKYALKHGLCTEAEAKDDWHKGNAIAAAANIILAQYRVCGVVASELEDDHMPMPRKASIEKLKAILQAKTDPRWFLHV
ncbi:hypothetical protein C8R47DRAFT_1313332 [Mycena vitilis]|nr:hypothetical protein C8R47DRAFT_1313332 [Mycena vitilis]